MAPQGIEPERPKYQVSEGGSFICFVRDPDGYRGELIERRRRPNYEARRKASVVAFGVSAVEVDLTEKLVAVTGLVRDDFAIREAS